MTDINAAPTEPRRPPLRLNTGGDAPHLDAADGELRAVMAGLVGEDERQRLLDALGDLDQHLPTAIDLCESAGLGPERTARFLLVEHHVPVETLMPAMIRDELDHYPAAPNVPANVRRYAAAYIREIIDDVTKGSTPATEQRRAESNGATVRLTAADRELLAQLDFNRRDHLTQAVRLLHDAGLNATEASAVLHQLAVPHSAIDTALNEQHYKPATGQHSPLWPPEAAARASNSVPAANVRPDGQKRGVPSEPDPQQLAPPASVVLRVAATGDPQRLVQLSEALGLGHGDAIRLWAASGVPADLAARSALAARRGDPATALADLQAHWSGHPTDWAEHLNANASPATTAHRILRQWADMHPSGHPTPTPEMA